MLLLSYDYFDETLRRNVPKYHCLYIYIFQNIYMYALIHMYSGGVVLLVISWLGVTVLQTKPIACQPALLGTLKNQRCFNPPLKVFFYF